MKPFYLLVLLFLVLPVLALAQPANDECTEAFMIPEQLEYCSGEAAFTTVNATASLDFNNYPVCFDERNDIRDVWFSFSGYGADGCGPWRQLTSPTVCPF